MTVSRRLSVSPARVWEVLADGWLYTGWVVGASHIRDVDEEWPSVGAKIHHAVGGWPLLIKDHTSVVESDPERRLVLQARAWPAGEARVELELRADGDGCVVTMSEHPTDGPGKWLHNPLSQRVLEARNREALDRLASLVEGRTA